MSKKRGRLLRDARVYLSGPMDFVASRAVEKKTGWRSRVGEFLRKLHVTVFDPWYKPEVRGLHGFGAEGETTTDVRAQWTFEPGEKGAKARAAFASGFWPAMHVDLRMVDTSDFLVCYCPTNIYSVGTPHEIIMARGQHKPVLFVSPQIQFESLAEMKQHFADMGDSKGRAILDRLAAELPIKENVSGAPSMWYTPLVGGENFFDGFGFKPYAKEFGWECIPLDEHEERFPPQKPLLPFLEELSARLPMKWDHETNKFVTDEDWILWELRKLEHGASVGDKRNAPSAPPTTGEKPSARGNNRPARSRAAAAGRGK
jgi:hypothetical protein